MVLKAGAYTDEIKKDIFKKVMHGKMHILAEVRVKTKNIYSAISVDMEQTHLIMIIVCSNALHYRGHLNYSALSDFESWSLH